MIESKYPGLMTHLAMFMDGVSFCTGNPGYSTFAKLIAQVFSKGPESKEAL